MEVTLTPLPIAPMQGIEALPRAVTSQWLSDNVAALLTKFPTSPPIRVPVAVPVADTGEAA